MTQPIFHRKNIHRYSKLLLISMAIVSIIFIFYYISWYEHPASLKEFATLSSGWNTYRSEESDSTIAKRIMTENIPDAALMVTSMHQNVKVYLDDTLLREFPLEQADLLGSSVQFIPLPEDYTGKVLQIETATPYIYYADSIKPVYLGTIPALTTFVLRDSLPHFIFLFLCICGGLCSIILSILSVKGTDLRWENLFFGIFCLLWGIYCIGKDYVTMLIFPTWLSSFFRRFSYLLYPIPILAYLYTRFNYYKKIILSELIAFCLIALMILCGTVFGWFAFYSVIEIVNTLHRFLFFAIAFTMILESRKGSLLLRYMIPCVLIAGFACIASLLNSKIGNTILYFIFTVAGFATILMVWIYNLHIFLKQYYQDKKAIQILNLKNELTLDYYDSVTEHIEQIKSMRHEMNHHFTALQILCRDEKWSQVKEYVDQIHQLAETMIPISYSENMLLNSILTNFMIKAKEHHIQVDHQIEVPAKIHLSDADLCTFLMNMLDNALEACIASTQGAPWIRLTMKTKANMLVIHCSNTLGKPIIKDGKNFISSKTELSFHGYGIKNMKTIAKRLNGELDIIHDEVSFTLRAVLTFENRKESGNC